MRKKECRGERRVKNNFAPKALSCLHLYPNLLSVLVNEMAVNLRASISFIFKLDVCRFVLRPPSIASQKLPTLTCEPCGK
jgi:hypothetical protein